MIPKNFINAWRAHAPWPKDAQVEQDLVISRALVEMFRHQDIADRLAFRGGTALYKLHLLPAARYSEDIDLVQIGSEAIGDTLDLVRSVLDPWLGTPKRKLNSGRVNLNYRFDSEDSPPVKMRLKIEINSREHFSELGHTKKSSRVDSRWFSGQAEATTFDINELLGTKLRALYQRKKGRDLFDLWFALQQGAIDHERLLRCFSRYMREGGQTVTRAQFEENLHGKTSDPDFRDDTEPLLRPGLDWDFDAAMDAVLTQIVSRLPGEPWKGNEE
ncbi:MAG: nucleotidyl transferase AbiEii/AbiGii toxin family protein [Myxococcota bacterium]